MEQHKAKMEEFVEKLWSNPALQNASLIKKENQVLSFIRENGRQLQAVFKQPDFFPELSWDDAVRLLLTVMTDTIVRYLHPRVEDSISRLVVPDIMDYFKNEGHLERDKFRDFILTNLRNKAVRDPYFNALEAYSTRYFERYIGSVLARRKFIYNELVRRDRLNLDHSLLGSYLGLAALFRPLYWHRFERSAGGPTSLSEVAKNARMHDTIYPEFERSIRASIGPVPSTLLKAGIGSCLNINEHPDVSGASRLIAILVSRMADYDPEQKVDKGAESPDKSWFNIHRRTAKFYGYDPQFLDELYQIAGEEGW